MARTRSSPRPEASAATKARARKILDRLDKAYPGATIALGYAGLVIAPD